MLIVSLLYTAIGIALFAFPSPFVAVLNLIPKFFPTLKMVADPVDPLLLSFATAYLLAQAGLGFWWLKVKKKDLFIASLGARGILLTLFVLAIAREGHIFGAYLLATYEVIAQVVAFRRVRL